jgi:bifunctional enzyme CysN/CysC
MTSVADRISWHVDAAARAPRERMQIVVAGHVDHGKSTIVGRLLADTGSLSEGKLAQVRETCRRSGKPFEYAFLLDALRDERAQGITIDSARVFFDSPRRQYVIIDAPGHVEFLKNMISGAARAEAAFLVVDAEEGVRENSRRHGYLMAMLGIRQVVVLVNKMDLVDHAEAAFRALETGYRDFLERVGVSPAAFIPVSGYHGDNIVHPSDAMAWYDGPTALAALDAFEPAPPSAERPLRMPVQDVYKFTGNGDSRRIVAGTVEAGTLRVGDEVVFLPSGKRGRVRTIEGFNRPAQVAVAAPAATGFTLDEQLYVTRGEVVARAGEPAPGVTTRIAASVIWLGRRPLTPGRDYILKLGSARVKARLEAIERVIDAAELGVTERKPHVDRHEVADCVLQLARPVALDPVSEHASTGRFVLVDDYEISGGGIVRAALPAVAGAANAGPDEVSARVTAARRAARYGQRPALVLVAAAHADLAALAAEALEARLFDDGRLVYHLPLEHDCASSSAATLAALLDLGAIVIATAGGINAVPAARLTAELTRADVARVWLGPRRPTDFTADSELPDSAATDVADALWAVLRERRSVPST